MPITRSGRAVTAASDVIGIELVFEARIASGGSTSSARRKSSSFAAASSVIASIIRSAGDELVGRRDARERLPGRPALRAEPSEALLASPQAPLDGARERIVQRDAATGRGDDLCDPAAHLAGPDDEHVLELHGE